MNEDQITASVIESIQLVALQSISGHEMSRVDFTNDADALSGLDDLFRFGHSGYVLSRGRIISLVSCVLGEPITVEEIQQRKLARDMKDAAL